MSEGHTERLEAALDGKYRIERKLGEGGMATVYLAEDIKHERKVALKILRPELAAVIGAERFLSEIKTTANLQHPHILALFDSGEAGGYLYYVMPYIDGETLREKLDREKQLGVEEAVRIARDVADALDYAHRAGVIHRDIKPGNILLHDGRPVVADFGIALAVSAAGGGRMTETGLSLGTPHYMSPEQASADRDLSPKSDVYSLGCVLYEMLAGQPPHTGPSAQSILVHILTEEAKPLTSLRHTVPPHVAATVSKAIEKLPADRFETARDFMEALGDPAFTHAAGARGSGVGERAPLPRRKGAPSRLYQVTTAVFVAMSLILGWLAFSGRGGVAGSTGGVVSFVLTEEQTGLNPPIVGSDGSIAYTSGAGLSILPSGSVTATYLQEAEGSFWGTFSPDGQRFAYMQIEGDAITLRSMPTTGGPARPLWGPVDVGNAFLLGAPSWGDDDWIYVTKSGVLGRVPDGGGQLDTLLALSPGRRVGRVTTLPGSRGILFTLVTTDNDPDNRVVLMDLQSRDTSTVISEGFDARWVESGHLIYATPAGTLYAVAFDPDRLEITGAPIPVLDGVAVAGTAHGRFDVSANGTLAYMQGDIGRFGAGGGVGGAFVFALVDLNGEVEVLPMEPTEHSDVAPSPDGTRLAYTRNDHIWIYDIDSGRNRPLTEEGNNHHNPVWSPDGRSIAFGSQRGSDQIAALYVLDVDGSAPPRRVGDTPTQDFPTDWLADGTILVFGLGPFADIIRMSASGDFPPEPLLEADWSEGNAKVSPDGSLLAYVSTEDGDRAHIFVRRWPALGGKTQVTSGEVPVRTRTSNALGWGQDSRTIYFQRGFRLWTATLASDDHTNVAVRDTGIDLPGYLWEVFQDGRILVEVDQTPEDATAPRLVVVSNWLSSLRQPLGLDD